MEIVEDNTKREYINDSKKIKYFPDELKHAMHRILVNSGYSGTECLNILEKVIKEIRIDMTIGQLEASITESRFSTLIPVEDDHILEGMPAKRWPCKIVGPHNPTGKSLCPYDFTDKNPISFIFLDRCYNVNNWRDLIVKLSNILRSRHEQDFHNVLLLKGKKGRDFFCRASDIRPNIEHTALEGTDILVQTGTCASYKCELAYAMTSLFGYDTLDLRIQTR